MGENFKEDDLVGQEEGSRAVKPQVAAPPHPYFHVTLKECDSNQVQVNLHLHIFRSYRLGDFNIKKSITFSNQRFQEINVSSSSFNLPSKFWVK